MKKMLHPFSHHTISLARIHPETFFLGVILRSPADGGATKNPVVTEIAEILRLRSE